MTGRVVATFAPPTPIWPDPDWAFSPDGKTLALWFRRGTNSYRDGDEEPFDRPQTVELWDVPDGPTREFVLELHRRIGAGHPIGSAGNGAGVTSD